VRTDSRGIPIAAEFAGNEALTIVEVLSPPDDSGRVTFRTFRLSREPWRPNGVRAQMKTTDLAWWCRVAREEGRVLVSKDGSELP
jgi:hypothetical protein